MPDSAQVRYALESAEQSAANGDFPTAARHLRDAIALQEAAVGAAHPDLASTLNNLGVVCERTGDLAEAERCYRRAFAIVTAALPAGDPLVETSRRNLAEFCAAQGIPLERGEVSAPQFEPEPAPAPPVAVVPPRAVRRSSNSLAIFSVVGVAVVVGLVLWVNRGGGTGTASTPTAAPAPASTPTPAAPPAAAPVTSPQPEAPPRSRSAAPKQDASIAVIDAQLCRTLARRAEWVCTRAGDPVGPGPLYFYTRLTTARDTVVVHRWYRDDRLQLSRDLQIQANVGSGYRTYSYFTVEAGHWRVELRTSDGRVLHEERFVVR
jgi:hypothetical protein